MTIAREARDAKRAGDGVELRSRISSTADLSAVRQHRRHPRPAAQPPPDRRSARASAGVEIIGDIELFARARAELPPHKVVGITGTNGKSTTTALVHHILADRGRAEPDGRQHRPADPRAGPAARRRGLCARTVELPDRPDPEPRLRRRGAAQHHARSSRPLRELRGLCGVEGAAVRDAVAGRIAVVDCRRRDQAHARDLDEARAIRVDIADSSTTSTRSGDQSDWPALQGPHNRAECGGGDCGLSRTWRR